MLESVDLTEHAQDAVDHAAVVAQWVGVDTDERASPVLRDELASHIAYCLAAQPTCAGRTLSGHKTSRLIAEGPTLGAASRRESRDIVSKKPPRRFVGMDDVSVSIEYENRVGTHVEGRSQQSRGVTSQTITTHKRLG